MAGPRDQILLRPQWVISNQLALPMVSVKEDKTVTLRGIVQVAIPITIFLDTLFDDKPNAVGRSLEDDQFHIFKSLEGALQTMGLSGKSCLLRTICELQRSPIADYSMAGELVTVLLTPKRGMRDFLHEYVEAELVGQAGNSTCGSVYSGCPVSLFNMFRKYTMSDKDVKIPFHDDLNIAEDDGDLEFQDLELSHQIEIESQHQPNNHVESNL